MIDWMAIAMKVVDNGGQCPESVRDYPCGGWCMRCLILGAASDLGCFNEVDANEEFDRRCTEFEARGEFII